MKAGIIAAGLGERLARGGISVPKPMARLGGEPLIARIIRAAASVNVGSIACIVNDLNPAVAEYLRAGSWPVPVNLLVKTTPSSMESLFSLAPLLGDEPFLLFTVDSVFPLTALEKFRAAVDAVPAASGVLAVTQYVDDEKPLWAQLDDQRRITALGEPARPSEFVTSGFYFFHPTIFTLIGEARARRFTALRQFLSLLIESGQTLYGVDVGKTIDVDHPEDLAKAEAFLKETADR
ncbi:MAG: NDP-sugar synthase [Deltaproteobacteria bacterium]|nr:NDP-sugar synthase [Deltaproteobacteria bacterium]